MFDRDHDIKVLNSLITTTIDSANGFEQSAEDARGGRFEALFGEFAGSLLADLHHRWIDLRTAVTSGGGDKAVIEEIERGEDYIKAKYEAAIADDKLSTTALEVIRTAFQSIRAGHDTASSLKREMQATS
jgi:hypothetical protein